MIKARKSLWDFTSEFVKYFIRIIREIHFSNNTDRKIRSLMNQMIKYAKMIVHLTIWLSNVNDFSSNVTILLLLTFLTHLSGLIYNTLSVGQQEYSSRQAGITTGIVLACLIPILLIIVCVGYRALKSRKEQREQEEVLARYQMHFTANFEK